MISDNPGNIVEVGPAAPPYGGVASVLAELVPRLRALGWSVYEWDNKRPEGAGILRTVWSDLRRVRQFKKWVRDVQVDVFHMHPSADYSFWRFSLYVNAARRAHPRARIAIQFHSGELEGWLRRMRAPGRAWIRRVLRKVDMILPVDSGQVIRFRELGAGAEVRHAANGVDTNRFIPGNRSLARQRLGLPEVGRVMLSVGALQDYKNHRMLLEIADCWPHASDTFHIVGAGPLRVSLEADVARRGLGAKVFFHGKAPDANLPTWYQAADVFLLPSLKEAFPVVALEAWASGIPVLTAPVGIMPTLLPKASPLGAVVSSYDSASWRDALARLIADQDMATCRQHALQYDWERVAADLSKILVASNLANRWR